MDLKKWNKFQIVLLIGFGICMVLFSVRNVNNKTQLISPFFNMGSDTQDEVIPTSGSVDWSNLTYVDPQIVANESQLMALATAGDGLSWETAYIIGNIKIEQNTTDYGLVFANLSSYVIIRDSVFYNFLPGYSGEINSLLIYNSQHIRIESCFLKAVTASNSVGIKIENSSDISLVDIKVTDYYLGIYMDESHNCTIMDSIFRGSYDEHILLEDSNSLSILNNRMINTHSDTNYRVVGAIYGSNITACLISGNDMNSEDQDISIWFAKDIIMAENQLPALSLHYLDNFTLEDNEINGRFWITMALNLTIERNTIQGSQFGIDAIDLYDFRIGENTFKRIWDEIFHFSYSTGAISAEGWVRPTGETQELIEHNYIFLVKGELYEQLPSNIMFSGNIIVPHAGFFLFVITSLGCLALYLNSFILYRKKQTQFKFLIQKLPEKGKDHPALASINMLVKTESVRFRQTSFRLLVLLGVFSAFALSEIYYGGRVLDTILEWFVGDSFHTELKLRAFLTAVELGILGVILLRTTKRKLKLINRMPKVMQNFEIHISTFDKRIITGLISVLAILEGIMFSVMLRGNSLVLVLVLGIFALLGFLFNLIMKIIKKVDHLDFEFLVMGLIFIFGYILTLNPENFEIRSPPIITQSILSWVFILVGGIGWFRAFVGSEEIDFAEKSQTGDISNGIVQKQE